MYGENAKDVMPRLSWNGKGPWRLTASRFAAAQRPVGKHPWGEPPGQPKPEYAQLIARLAGPRSPAFSGGRVEIPGPFGCFALYPLQGTRRGAGRHALRRTRRGEGAEP